MFGRQSKPTLKEWDVLLVQGSLQRPISGSIWRTNLSARFFEEQFCVHIPEESESGLCWFIFAYMSWWISWRAENRNMVFVSEEQMETMAIWEFCHLPAFKTHERSEFPISSLMSEGLPIDPLWGGPFKKLPTQESGFFSLTDTCTASVFPMKNWKRQEQKTCQPKSAKLKKLLVQTQKFFTENILKKNCINFCQNSEKTHTNLCYFSGFVWFQPKAKILFTSWF